MSDTNLLWKFMGRQIRPYAFGVAYLCALIFIFNVFVGEGIGTLFDDQSMLGLTFGMTAFMCFIFLVTGWWIRSDKLMRWGLLLSCGLFSARAAFIFLDIGLAQLPGWISIGIVLMSGGAWLLERDANRGRVSE